MTRTRPNDLHLIDVELGVSPLMGKMIHTLHLFDTQIRNLTPKMQKRSLTGKERVDFDNPKSKKKKSSEECFGNCEHATNLKPNRVVNFWVSWIYRDSYSEYLSK